MGTLQRIRGKLLRWYDANRRDLPWRRNPDPYRVWLSEVMLQQTRVVAVVPYYKKCLRLFPTVQALAKARPQAVLRAWAGLGYYSRARSLHSAARAIARNGTFPSTYEGWLELPGIGPYTAAAISSIALGQPHAVVDGNVRRVLARLFTTSDSFEEKAAQLLDLSRPGDFNQAVMELGATVCLPKTPLCGQCPLRSDCRARKQRAIAQFPSPKTRRKTLDLRLRLAVVELRGGVLLAPPTGHGLWPHFWSLPQLPHPGLQRLDRLGAFRHVVTYRNIQIEVFRARLKPASLPGGLRVVPRADLRRLPLSTPCRKALEKHYCL